MRLLIYDEAPIGHHGFYMRHMVVAAHKQRGAADVLYCFPTDLDLPGVEYVPLPPSVWTRPLRLCDRQLNTKLLVRYKWRQLDQLVRKTGADMVLLMDAEEFLKPGIVPNVTWDWVPLYMHPRGARRSGERLPVESLRSRRCRFVYTLDEGVTNKLVAATGKHVRHFPDLAESDQEVESPLAAAIQQDAQGRPIISALGTLTHHKNTKLLLEVARQRTDWFVVVAGTVHWNRLSRSESRMLREACSWPNVLMHLATISDRELNAITAHSDVLYGCYLDFPHSSNKLTKACLFRVPVVVAEGDYMGEVVGKYRIGTTCDPTKTAALENAIDVLLAAGLTEPRWDAYLERNSVDSLRDSASWLFQ